MANELIGEDRGGGVRIRGDGGVPVLEETYTFKVLAASKSTSKVEVLNTTGLPIRGETQSAYGLTVCRSINATQNKKQPRLWVVVCEFSSDVEEGQDSQDLSTDPIVWVPVYKTKFERMTEASFTDVDGDAIANSAGQPYSTGINLPRFIPVWDLYQFEPATVKDEDVLDRNEVVNSVEFKNRPAKTLLCTVVNSEIGFYYGQRRRFTQYQVKYNEKKWTHKRQDTGTVYLDGGSLEPYVVGGVVINGPLDGAGGKVAAGNPPAILEFDQFRSVDFHTFLRT